MDNRPKIQTTLSPKTLDSVTVISFLKQPNFATLEDVKGTYIYSGVSITLPINNISLKGPAFIQVLVFGLLMAGTVMFRLRFGYRTPFLSSWFLVIR